MEAEIKKRVAIGLLKNGCVKFSIEQPFTYASGLKGPIYCDNRMVLGLLDLRELVIESFVELIKSKKWDYDYIGGIATAGIPHAAFIADRLKLPMVYVRPKAKEHGKKNQVEGSFVPHSNVLLIEDLVNQGSSLNDAVNGLKLADLNCDKILCIVDYEMNTARDRLNQLGISLHSLTDFSVLVESAFELQLIHKKDKETLIEWHQNPKLWSEKFN